MRYVWDERKRKSNLRDHGIDFVDAPLVFANLTFTYEDDRFAYDEVRFVTLGLLKGVPVSIVHTESEATIRVISFRRATDNETEVLFNQIKDQLPAVAVDEKQRGKSKRRTSGDRRKPRRTGHRPSRSKGRTS
jgi:uncharacterized protein